MQEFKSFGIIKIHNKKRNEVLMSSKLKSMLVILLTYLFICHYCGNRGVFSTPSYPSLIGPGLNR